jgi:cytochrome c peroxidase
MVIRTLIISLLFIGFISAPAIALAVNEPIQPIEDAKPKNLNMVELGKMLFSDPRLSKSGFISCNSCHNLSMGGADSL